MQGNGLSGVYAYDCLASGFKERSRGRRGRRKCLRTQPMTERRRRHIESDQWSSSLTRQTFLAKRAALKGKDIFLGDDLTPAQVAHRKECMPEAEKARKQGKFAVYRDGCVLPSDNTRPVSSYHSLQSRTAMEPWGHMQQYLRRQFGYGISFFTWNIRVRRAHYRKSEDIDGSQNDVQRHVD